jgi:hypothetical protein
MKSRINAAKKYMFLNLFLKLVFFESFRLIGDPKKKYGAPFLGLIWTGTRAKVPSDPMFKWLCLPSIFDLKSLRSFFYNIIDKFFCPVENETKCYISCSVKQNDI